MLVFTNDMHVDVDLHPLHLIPLKESAGDFLHLLVKTNSSQHFVSRRWFYYIFFKSILVIFTEFIRQHNVCTNISPPPLLRSTTGPTLTRIWWIKFNVYIKVKAIGGRLEREQTTELLIN